MARQDFIDAQKVLDDLERSFREVEGAIESNAETLKRLQVEYNKLPSGFIAAQKQLLEITTKHARSEEQIIKVSQQKERLKQQEINTLSKEIRLQQQRERILDKNAKAAQKEMQKLQASAGIYNSVQQKLNALNKEYRDLAVQKELTGKLTDKEAKRYDFLSGKITKYDTILKGVDASMGKYGRNVGNYASGFSPLANSINQLSRELPALGVNTQTFFLAISNNIPAVFDAYNQIIAQNKILISQGQPVQSFFKQLAVSIFSIGTALSIGITLLTLYGAQISEALFNTEEKTKADLKAKEALEQKNDVEKQYTDTLRQSASEEISRSRVLFETAANVNISMEARKKAIDDLRERYPVYLKGLKDEEILAGNTAIAEAKLNDALMKRAFAIAIQGKITEAYGRLTDEIVKQQREEEKLTTIDADVRKMYEQRQKSVRDNASATEDLGKQEQALGKLGKTFAQNRIIQSQNTQKEISKEIDSLVQLFNKYAGYIDVVDEGGRATSKQAESVERLGEANSAAVFQNTIARLEKELSLISKENNLYGFLALQLQLVKDAYEAMYGEQEKSNEETEKTLKFGTAEYYNDLISKLKAEQSAVADSTEEYRLYNSIIKSVQDQLDGLTNKFLEGSSNALQKQVSALTEERDNLAQNSEEYKHYTEEIRKAQLELDKLTGKAQQEVDSFLSSYTSGFFSEIGLDALNFFTELDENGQSMFDRLIERADTFGERAAIAFLGFSEVAQQAFAFINQQSQAAFQAEYERLEQRYELAQRFAGQGEEAQEEIRRQYEERRRDIIRRELEAQKEQAIFNATINVAQGVTAAYATGNIPLAILIGVLGAAQIAFIASQQIPAYATGTQDHIGGNMLVNDASGSNYREMIIEPNKAPYIPKGRNRVINAPKGTKVFTAHETKEMQSLNKMLMSNDIAPISDTLTRDSFSHIPVMMGGSGMNKEDMKDALAETLGNMPMIRQNWDKNGMNEWYENQGNKTILTNNRVSFKGISL